MLENYTLPAGLLTTPMIQDGGNLRPLKNALPANMEKCLFQLVTCDKMDWCFHRKSVKTKEKKTHTKTKKNRE
jgi:hypothetical protein